MNKIDTTCEHLKLRMIACAVGLQECTRTESNIIPLPGGERVIAIGTPVKVRELLDVAPAAGSASPAAAGLTDERLKDIFCELAEEAAKTDAFVTYKDIARAIEREVLAHAGVGAQPVAVPADVRAALDRMCQPLHESRLSGATAEADARCMATIKRFIDGLAAPSSDDVRNAALEEAAKVCDSVNNYDNPMTAGDCADSIRALKSAAAQSVGNAGGAA